MGNHLAWRSFADQVPAILEAWYGGCELGNVVADIIFGDVNPSGKLPSTFPKQLTDVAAHKSPMTYPGKNDVIYEEGIFVGYRHFDRANIMPQFPFGHGLSYTSFEYADLELSQQSFSGENSISVSFNVMNVGDRAGKEIVQLYIQDLECSLPRPIKELKAFNKVTLASEESTQITFEINKDILSFFDESGNQWKVENGEFKVLIGSSSADIRLEASFFFEN